jgi:hypothetical protein
LRFAGKTDDNLRQIAAAHIDTSNQFEDTMATGHPLSTEILATGHLEVAMSFDFPSRGLDKFVLRLPEGMREKVGAAARANKRTMNAEIVQRLEASFASAEEPLLVIKRNTPEADIIWELRDSMQGLKAEVAELRTDPEMAGVPDFTEEGRAILQTRQMVAELLESVKAIAKPTKPEDENKKN